MSLVFIFFFRFSRCWFAHMHDVFDTNVPYGVQCQSYATPYVYVAHIHVFVFRFVIQTSTPTTVITSMEIVQRLPHQNNRIFCQQKLQCRLMLCRRRRGRHRHHCLRRRRRRYHCHHLARHHPCHSSIQHGKVRVAQRKTQSNLYVNRALIVWSTIQRQSQRIQRPTKPYEVSHRARTMFSCHQPSRNVAIIHERERFHERS